MRPVSIPRCNDVVQYFVVFDGDDQVSGPFTAVVVAVGSTLTPTGIPELDLLVELPTTYGRRPGVPYSEGREFWLPVPQ